MAVTYDEFYPLFMESEPNIINQDVLDERKLTLERLLGHGKKLIVVGPGNVDVDLDGLKWMLRNKTPIKIGENRKEDKFPTVVFIESTRYGSGDKFVKQEYEVTFHERVLEYVKEESR